MNKIIWSCWFQGRRHAPPLVEKCLTSWERSNPGWELRCLDQHELRRYVDLPGFAGKRITYASLSEVVRILLLKEYGGIWVDATAFCHRPLEEWLEPWFRHGFFAFDRPGGNRPLSSWFLASEESHYLVDRWCARTLAYWSERTCADSYFWFHDLFRDLCESDAEFGRTWDRVPKLSAAGPHAIQRHRPSPSTATTRSADRERFSSLEKLVPVHRFSEVDRVDWTPRPVDTSKLKLTILDSFFALTERWPLPEPRPLAPIAPAAELPVPGE